MESLDTFKSKVDLKLLIRCSFGVVVAVAILRKTDFLVENLGNRKPTTTVRLE